MKNVTISRCETSETLVQTVLAAFLELARQAIDQRGVFRVSLSGGSTPKRLYEEIAQSDLDFSRIRWFWGDERNVAHEHPDSNFRMVKQALLDPAAIAPANVFPVAVNVDDPQAAAADYEATLRREFAADAPDTMRDSGDSTDFPAWDLVLLGLGDDAHTASLFPATSALDSVDRWFVENWVEKFSAFRYTLTAPAINSGREIWFLVAGAGKRDAVGQVMSDARDVRLYPSQLIQPTRFFVTSDALPDGLSV